jgi:hypothetical protein
MWKSGNSLKGNIFKGQLIREFEYINEKEGCESAGIIV